MASSAVNHLQSLDLPNSTRHQSAPPCGGQSPRACPCVPLALRPAASPPCRPAVVVTVVSSILKRQPWLLREGQGAGQVWGVWAFPCGGGEWWALPREAVPGWHRHHKPAAPGAGGSQGKEPEVWPAEIQAQPRGLPTSLVGCPIP